MRSLWFKQRYVASILDGSKTDTIRAARPGLPRPGEIVTLNVGPRPAFAHAQILSIEPVAEDELGADRLETVRQDCSQSGSLVRLRFELLE